MPKDIPQPVNPPNTSRSNDARDKGKGGFPQPLSGSKRVKQQNHSRHNNGEG